MKSNQVTVNSVHSNWVKMHSKLPSVMAFCSVCLGILPVKSYPTRSIGHNKKHLVKVLH